MMGTEDAAPVTPIDAAMQTLGWETAYGAERLGVTPRFMRRVRYGHVQPPPEWQAWFMRAAAPLAAEPLPPGWNPEPGMEKEAG